MTWDVVISGAGIIGVSLALELRRRGAQVLVLDSGEPGKEASSAAAGMLAASDPETPEKLRSLAWESAEMYPAFIKELESASGLKVDFRHGAIALLQTAEGLTKYRPLSAAELKQLNPALDAHGHPAYFIPSENSVDPALMMQAALGAARAAGVEIRGQTAVQQMASGRDQVEVVTASHRFLAHAAVNCQGAWAGAPVRPRKGQMIYLQPKKPALLKHVVRAPGVYLVPRGSGKILAGATVEDVGYNKTVVPENVHELHRAAAQVVPELASAPIVASWAGLRPGTPDDLPILGRLETSGVFIASGHFRSGILLAPITAKIMADLIDDKTPALDVAAFSPSRFSSARART
jgi:glycine oxidase